ncbi:MAG: ROK family protein [Rikenellaceae bacterium]
MYRHDNRVVMTLDAGGTNFVFSAIQANEYVLEPVTYPSNAANLDNCLATLVKGFNEVKAKLDTEPVAISFAFPGPADYANGVIGDLPNFPSFRGGVALGAFLEEKFNLPVFINNDGDLFAYGEALAGALNDVNDMLKEAGNPHEFKNVLGITFGTGFGAGVVLNKRLLAGDNGAGGDIWCFRNKKYPSMIAEESVSIRAVIRVYEELSGEKDTGYTPKDVYDIAEGKKEGNKEAAIKSFAEFGEVAGDAIAQVITVVDGIVVIGGGLAGASKYIIPSLVKEMNSEIGTFGGASFPRQQMKSYDLTDEAGRASFMENKSIMVKVPQSDKEVLYNKEKQVGVIVSSIGASKAIALGAYAYALAQIGDE